MQAFVRCTIRDNRIGRHVTDYRSRTTGTTATFSTATMSLATAAEAWHEEHFDLQGWMRLPTLWNVAKA